MFIPPLNQSSKSRDLIVLIEQVRSVVKDLWRDDFEKELGFQISARAYLTTTTAMFASEVMSADTDVWLPGEPKMWLEDTAQQWREMDEIIMLDGGGVPSIQRFQKPYDFIYRGEFE